jgi:hypothetical protein
MDTASMLAKATGTVLLYVTVHSVLRNLRIALEEKQSMARSGFVVRLGAAEKALHRFNTAVLTWTGLRFVLRAVNAVFGTVFAAVFAPFRYIYTRAVPAANSGRPAAPDSRAPSGPGAAKDPSALSVGTEQLFNKLILWIWHFFMVSFSLGMILNN